VKHKQPSPRHHRPRKPRANLIRPRRLQPPAAPPKIPIRVKSVPRRTQMLRPFPRQRNPWHKHLKCGPPAHRSVDHVNYSDAPRRPAGICVEIVPK
jgi:hypothetical protein